MPLQMQYYSRADKKAFLAERKKGKKAHLQKEAAIFRKKARLTKKRKPKGKLGRKLERAPSESLKKKMRKAPTTKKRGVKFPGPRSGKEQLANMKGALKWGLKNPDILLAQMKEGKEFYEAVFDANARHYTAVLDGLESDEEIDAAFRAFDKGKEVYDKGKAVYEGYQVGGVEGAIGAVPGDIKDDDRFKLGEAIYKGGKWAYGAYNDYQEGGLENVVYEQVKGVAEDYVGEAANAFELQTKIEDRVDGTYSIFRDLATTLI